MRADTDPRRLARIAGVLYLIIIVVGLSGEAFVRDRVIVAGDAAATAANLLALEGLWRGAIAAEIFYLTLAVPLALIFLILLRPVSRDLALLAVFFNLTSIAIEALNKLHLLAALMPLGSAPYLSAFEPAQLQAMASLSIRSFSHGFAISLIFFGAVCLVLGYLIFRSGFLPKALGVLMLIAGACYLTNSFALLLAPGLASRLFPAILVPAFVGEASLCGWLLVKGVDVEKWHARAQDYAPSNRTAAPGSSATATPSTASGAPAVASPVTRPTGR